jgi:hypothetical protein
MTTFRQMKGEMEIWCNFIPAVLYLNELYYFNKLSMGFQQYVKFYNLTYQYRTNSNKMSQNFSIFS